MSIRKKSILGTALVAAALGLSPANAASFFYNDWDSTDFGPNPGFVILPSYEGWTSTAGAGIEVQFNNVAGVPLSSPNLVELDSNNNSEMSRSIDAGNYVLNFFYSARPGVPITSNGIDVLVNGTSIFNVTGAGGGGTSWSQQTVYFTLAAPGTLSFAAVGTSDSLGGYLENVQLSVPEPGAWALMIAGFGFVGASMRRRSRRTVTYA